MGPWIEIISASILTLKELMDRSHNFLDTLITHCDHPWHGTIFLSLFSLLCSSVCLSPLGDSYRSTLLTPAYGLRTPIADGPTSCQPRHFTEEKSERSRVCVHCSKPGKSLCSVSEKDCLAKGRWPSKEDRGERPC